MGVEPSPETIAAQLGVAPATTRLKIVALAGRGPSLSGVKQSSNRLEDCSTG